MLSTVTITVDLLARLKSRLFSFLAILDISQSYFRCFFLILAVTVHITEGHFRSF